MTQFVEIPVSIGEVIDKITILEIKARQLTEPVKLQNVRTELDLLRARRDQCVINSVELDSLTTQLKAANQRLWDMEHAIREHEHREDFGSGFVVLARSIYRTNDKRAALKRQINIALGSRIIEEKSHTPFDHDE